MATGALLDREEYIEQAYFFRVFRERLASEFQTARIKRLRSNDPARAKIKYPLPVAEAA